MHWHRLPRELVGSVSPELFRNHRDVVLRDVVGGHSGGGLEFYLVILEVFCNFSDSVTSPRGHSRAPATSKPAHPGPE